jgi:zeaxanthin glucosyltransferase
LHFGIVSPPVPGHIHPFGALGRELIERGHRVTFFHMPDLEQRVRNEELEFVAIGVTEYPLGSLPRSLAELGRRKGMSALRFTIRAVADTTEMMLREMPSAIQAAGIDTLLVDQTEPAGGTIAEHLGLPFITICNALALNREADVPPPFTPWNYYPAAWARARNRIGYEMADRMTRPIHDVVARYRREWRLPRHHSPEESFSPLAQISQQPALFDFPRRCLPSCFYYLGPLRKASSRTIAFPWERLDGRPVIYASLGTLQNSRRNVFRCFAEACNGLDAQLVIAGTSAGGLPGNPLVVEWAPQRELMARASMTLTHAGLNTVLDSLSFGVPLVALPITYEQPAIGARLGYTGAGEVTALSQLNATGLRTVIRRVMEKECYRLNARRIARSIQKAGGISVSADIILAKTKKDKGNSPCPVAT